MAIHLFSFFCLSFTFILAQALPQPRSEPAGDLSYYPSPWMDSEGEWADAYAKAANFVSQLTLLEKVNLTTGLG